MPDVGGLAGKDSGWKPQLRGDPRGYNVRMASATPPRFRSRQQNLTRRSVGVVLGLMLALTLQAWGDTQSDRQAIARLVAAGKVDEAEFYCRERLSDSNLPLPARSALTLELMDVLSGRARREAGASAAAHFAAAERVAEDYTRVDTDSLLRFLVAFRQALLPRLAAESCSANESAEENLGKVRATIRRLEQLADNLDAELRQRRPRDSHEVGYLTERELRNLRDRVGLELGVTFLAQAEAYRNRSEDRLLAAGRATAEFEKLSPTALSSELWIDSRLKLIASLRMRSDWSACGAQVRILEGMRLSPAERTAITTELIRIAIARKDWERLTRLVARHPAEGPLGDEASLAALEAYLALANESRQSGQTTQATDWEQRAGQLIDKASAQYGKHWLWRAQRLWAHAGGAGGTPAQAAGTTLHLHAAEGLLQQQRWQAARLAYEGAAKSARDRGESDLLLQSMRALAGLDLRQAHAEIAAARLRAVALELPAEPAAAATHLMALKLMAGQRLASPDEATDSSDAAYVAALREHLVTWPATPFAAQVHLWLGRYLEHRGDHLQAVRELRQVADDSTAGLATAIDSERTSLLVLLARDKTAPMLAEADRSMARWQAIAAAARYRNSGPPGSRRGAGRGAAVAGSRRLDRLPVAVDPGCARPQRRCEAGSPDGSVPPGRMGAGLETSAGM